MLGYDCLIRVGILENQGVYFRRTLWICMYTAFKTLVTRFISLLKKKKIYI